MNHDRVWQGFGLASLQNKVIGYLPSHSSQHRTNNAIQEDKALKTLMTSQSIRPPSEGRLILTIFHSIMYVLAGEPCKAHDL